MGTALESGWLTGTHVLTTNHRLGSTLFNKLFFPPGSVEGEISAWADVAKQLADFTDTWRKSIGSGLSDIVNDPSTFTGFCEKSPITGERPSLDGLTGSISQSVGAYVSTHKKKNSTVRRTVRLMFTYQVISAIINQLGFVVTRAADLDVANLQQTKKLQWDTHCGDGYDSHGVCDAYYFGKFHRRLRVLQALTGPHLDGTDTYALVNPHGYDEMQTSYADLMQKLLGGDNPLTTGELLFSNGYQCVHASAPFVSFARDNTDSSYSHRCTASCGKNGGCEPALDDP